MPTVLPKRRPTPHFPRMAEGQWNIDTLKEFLTAKIDAVKAAHQADVDLINARLIAAQDALKLKSDADGEHFKQLNNEAMRVDKATTAGVQREVYETDKKASEEWRRSVEDRLGKMLSEDTFNAYKETTQRATNIQSGRGQGIGATGATVFQIVIGAAAVVAIIGAIFALVRPTGTPVSYQPPAAIIAPLK
jgi:hypothetical protein